MARSGPETVAEARKYRYGAWAGDPAGRAYCEGYCIQNVWPNERGPIPHQCGRRIARDGYCKQHHPDAVAARERKSADRYKKEMDSILRPGRIRDIYRKALKSIVRASGATAPRLREMAREALDKAEKL